MADTWVQRTAVEFAQAIESELPSGAAWPRDPDSGLMRWVAGNAQIWGDVEARSATFLTQEADPRYALELLPDWERAFGLPDPCLTQPETIPDRRTALVNKMTIEGGQSRAFFISAAASIGYTIGIYEYAPYTAGLSRCGDTRPDGVLTLAWGHCGAMVCGADRQGLATLTGGTEWDWQLGAPDLRYFWKVKVSGNRVTWFRGGTGVCGQDHLAEISLALDLECMIRRWAPAHTVVLFDYSALGSTTAGGALSGASPRTSLGTFLILF